MSAAIDLLADLVQIPSLSGQEAACRDALIQWLSAAGINAWADGRNVIGCVGDPDRGPGLLFLSHIDVVPPGPGWHRDPFDGVVEDGWVRGRGATDAKASVAAMAVAAGRVGTEPLAGHLALAFVCDEETGGEGIEACKDRLPPFDAVVVGEPTGLHVCSGQRGLLRVTLRSHGRQAHAARPWEGENAIPRAARAVLALADLELGAPDPVLGRATLEPTIIRGGTRPNVLPGLCEVELDGRTTRSCSNARMLELLAGATDCEVVVRSDRFRPVVTAPEELIVRLALVAAAAGGEPRAFGGVSDLFHVRDRPGVILGPGQSVMSHAPDEAIETAAVEAAVKTYVTLVRSFLGAEARAGSGSRGRGQEEDSP